MSIVALMVNAQNYAQNELLVRFKEDVSEVRITEINQSLGTEIKNTISTSMKLYLLKITNGATTLDTIRAYEAQPEVKYAEPNYTSTTQ